MATRAGRGAETTASRRMAALSLAHPLNRWKKLVLGCRLPAEHTPTAHLASPARATHSIGLVLVLCLLIHFAVESPTLLRFASRAAAAAAAEYVADSIAAAAAEVREAAAYQCAEADDAGETYRVE